MTAQPTQTDYRKHLVTALRTIEKLEHRLSHSRDAWLDEPIAIVGMGCRLPGGADSPEAFWELLRNGVDATGEFPADRADALPFYDADPEASGKAYTIRGGFLDRVDQFEPEVFGISPREALGMDPQHRIMLEVTWEALERAGYAPDSLEGSQTGVWLGISTTDYVRLRQQIGDINDVDAYQLVGEPSFLAGRISYTLGLRGPSQVLDTACSSSLVALHDACQALRLRQCDMALAGGVNLMLAPYGFVLMSKFQALSTDGRCKTFSADADGYARGEGGAVVVLRRLADAVESGDNILAVVRGTSVNHDGRSSGLTVPNPAAQQHMLQSALAQARIEPHQVDYIEAHGTGTSLGDPIELRALDAVLGEGRAAENPLLIGAVKTNIGHLEPAAGVAGLAKLVLSMEHGEIPPSLHFAEPNPNVAWDRLNINVAATHQNWPARGPERVGGVSSFGVSGTNAHALVSSAPAPPARELSGEGHTTGRAQSLFMASARTEAALQELIERYVRHLRRADHVSLTDLCYTTHVGRARQTTGLATVAGTVEELADTLEGYLDGRSSSSLVTGTLPPHKHRKSAWLFTGQGSQYAGMGRALLAEPAFAAAFDEAAAAIDPDLDIPLRQVLWPAEGQATPVNDTRFTQPALFALEYALAKLFLSWGTRPAALAGHSIGEIAAACVAGVFSLADAGRLVTARARLMSELPTGGVMVALRTGERAVRSAIANYPSTVSIAAVNAPDEVVISGASADVAAVQTELEAQGIKARRLTVSHAFHSPLMTPIVAPFRSVLESLSYAKPTMPLISAVTGEQWTDAEVGPEYWVRHALGAVRFADTVSTLHGQGFSTFVEIGPAPILSALGRRTVAEGATFIPTLRRDQDALRLALHAAGWLRLRGAAIDWSAFHRDEQVRRVDLPTTPWNRESYWFREALPAAPTTSAETALPATEDRPLPGIRRRLPTALPSYELDLRSDHFARLTRSLEGNEPFLPFGALAGTALTAAEDCLGGTFACVAETRIIEQLPVTGERTVHLVVTPVEGGQVRCEYRGTTAPEAAAGAPWRLHARITLRRKVTTAQLTESLRTPPVLDRGRYPHALSYAPATLSSALTDAIDQALQSDDGVLVTLANSDWPVLMDAVTAASCWAASPERRDGVPVTGVVRQVTSLSCTDVRAVRYVRATALRPGSGEQRGTVDFFAADGGYLGGADKVRLISARQSAPPSPWRDAGDILYDSVWQRLSDEPASAERAASAEHGTELTGQGFLLLTDRGGYAETLATQLRARGAHVQTAEPPVEGAARASHPDVGALNGLLNDWVASSEHPCRVLLLSGLDAPRLDHTDAWGLEEYAARGDLLAVELVRLLAEREDCPEATVTLVTRGAMPAGADELVTTPSAHTLWGLGRVFALEHPERWGGAIDVAPDPAADDTTAEIERLVAALERTSTEDEQALRGPDVYVSRVLPREPEPDELRAPPPVRADGSYVITGAFGAIGLSLADWLARAGAGRLVLLGRTPLPDRTTWNQRQPAPVRNRIRAVRELERLGVEVTVVTADVADEATMLAVFQELNGHPLPLRGVVHAAGVSQPQFVRDVDADTYRAVWRPKVIGGWLLHQLTRTAELDFFLGFSSIAATWGSQHLSSYAAGNAFLDGLALHRRGQGLPALSVAWGPWELESNLFDEEVMNFLTSTGLFPLSQDQCLRLLGGLLSGPRPQQVVCAVDWSIYKPVMEARIERPILRGIEFSDDTGSVDAETDALIKRLRQDTPDARTERVTGLLRDVVADVAGVRADTVERDADVMGYGLDSLMVMDVVRQCQRRLGVSVKASQLFERTTLGDWADLVDQRFRQDHLADDAAHPEPPTTTGDGADHTDPAWLRQDVTLDPAIEPPTDTSVGRAAPERPGHVLLTGATGFLGAYLLEELLARTEATVHCLVRCPDPEEGLRRVQKNYQQYLTWPAEHAHRITIVPGDLAEPLLGLPESTFDALGEQLDAIYHNGAWVNFSYTYDQLRPANLGGTEEILRLAAHRRLTPVSYVSTYGIWGIPEDGRTVIAENDDIAEAGKLVTGYVQTKWSAERLVELGRDRGIPIDLYRPGRVLGDSRTGAALTTHFTIRVIKGCLQLGMVPDLDLDIEMTPIDYVTSALVAIGTGTPLHEMGRGTTYHLVNRHTMRFAELAHEMCARWDIRLVPLDEWWQALRAGYGDGDNELHPVMDVVEEFVVGGEEAIDYDDRNTIAALEGSQISCPPLDTRLLSIYFDWMIRVGYLPKADHLPHV
uniref:Type I polyketide synthase n=1 Tax=Streptomyces sp. CNQ-418 TaxID=467194 RepID=J7H193_9ACTN|nr:type I polyketide synthase [Streptomyces sp. CNQ-418]